jgi:hypothetical protein
MSRKGAPHATDQMRLVLDGVGAPSSPRWSAWQVTGLGLLVGSAVGALGWWSGQWSLALVLGLAGGCAIGRYGAGRRHGR